MRTFGEKSNKTGGLFEPNVSSFLSVSSSKCPLQPNAKLYEMRIYLRRLKYVLTFFISFKSVYLWQRAFHSTSGGFSTSALDVEPFQAIGKASSDPNKTLAWLDLWQNDTDCAHFRVSLMEDNSIRQRALVSFPGSGNTWLRMLLMGMTGLYIDTVYDDEVFSSLGCISFVFFFYFSIWPTYSECVYE